MFEKWTKLFKKWAKKKNHHYDQAAVSRLPCSLRLHDQSQLPRDPTAAVSQWLQDQTAVSPLPSDQAALL